MDSRHVTDPYVKRSVAEGFRSRAAYKLTEIADKDRLLRPGMVVVDLGAAPGSWTQVVRKRLARADGRLAGRIVALDILPMDPLPDVEVIQGDFHDEAVERQLVDLLAGAPSRRRAVGYGAELIGDCVRRTQRVACIWPSSRPTLPLNICNRTVLFSSKRSRAADTVSMSSD